MFHHLPSSVVRGPSGNTYPNHKILREKTVLPLREDLGWAEREGSEEETERERGGRVEEEQAP